MRLIALLAVASVLAACSARPLTERERAFIDTIHGDAVDATRIRVVRGSLTGAFSATVDPRPRTTCRERLSPPLEGPRRLVFPAFVLDEAVYFTHDFWRSDFLAGYPERLHLRDAMRLAHELTHVWQWQARAKTGYHPLKAMFEHVEKDDPYLVEIDPGRAFLDYGYEQQGILVEEFVCCRWLDPHGTRTAILRDKLSAHFPGLVQQRAVSQTRIELPWDGAEIEGICS